MKIKIIVEGKTMSLKTKIDFAIVFTVKKANPNGDPLNGNRPRVDYGGFGEVSDVCLKRKLRNRLLDMGEEIFVQSDDYRKEGDTFRSLKERFDANEEIQTLIRNAEEEKKKTKKKPSISDQIARIACKTWYDVRAFGQVFAFGNEEDSDSVSIGVRGPVSIQNAVSLDPVDVFSQQITKSVNLKTQEDPDKKGSDTMGMKHRVEFGVYVSYGSINCQLAEKTGFSDEDADKLLAALRSLFVNDESTARPAGSMKVEKVVWWKHNCKNGQYASADVHESLSIDVDEKSKKPVVTIKKPLDGLEPIIYDGENI
jgi:CRISPR-associated protein Csd2